LFRHLLAIRRALDAGYDVRGYFHWSLMRTYEWTEGYKPFYGLFRVNDDLTLSLTQSAMLYRFFIRHRFMDTSEDVTQWSPKRLGESGELAATEVVRTVGNSAVIDRSELRLVNPGAAPSP